MNRIELVRERLSALAGSKLRRVVLPEAAIDHRTLRAAIDVHQRGIVSPVLVGNKEITKALAESCGLDISELELHDPDADDALRARLIETYRTRRATATRRDKPQSATIPTGSANSPAETGAGADGGARLPASDLRDSAVVSDPVNFGNLLVAAGLADGALAGAKHSTPTVLRSGLRCIGRNQEVPTLCSYFIMILPDSDVGDGGLILFTDCAIVADPTASELADIAITTADSGRRLLGIEPRIAMLSFSTHASANHPRVKKVLEATALLRTRRSDLCCDGELQVDAALIASVACEKVENSPVAGRANILVFPDLDSGNIGYKLVQRLAHAEVIGPVANGFALPTNDLSRGCSWENIADSIIMTAAQANARLDEAESG